MACNPVVCMAYVHAANTYIHVWYVCVHTYGTYVYIHVWYVCVHTYMCCTYVYKHNVWHLHVQMCVYMSYRPADKLIKHTGYGNAAGLLLGKGLLGGGASAEQANYSSDSESDQDTAE